MKVGTDGVLLGAWAMFPGPDKGRLALDVGAGTGLVSLMLAQRFTSARVEAIEIDKASAEECAANFQRSAWADRLMVREADFMTAEFAESYDLIVSNPPFFNNGAKALDASRLTARHEDTLPLSKLITHSAELLNSYGSIALIIPAERYAEAEYAAALAGLHLWREVLITTVPGKAPRRVLLQFTRCLVDSEDIKTPVTPTYGKLIKTVSSEILSTGSEERSPWYRDLVKDFYLKP